MALFRSGTNNFYKLSLLLIAPLCFAISPLFYSYSNSDIGFNRMDLAESIGIFSLATILLFGIFYFIIDRILFASRRNERLELTGFWLTVFLLLFYVLYSPVKKFLYDLIGEGFPLAGWDVPVLIIGVDKILFPLLSGVVIGMFILVKHFRNTIPAINRFFLALGILFISISAIFSSTASHKSTETFTYPESSVHGDLHLPNIYYIILDSYSGFDVLKNYDGYDNFPFMNRLQSKGFYVAQKSRCNYPITMLSLRASLNMNFFPISAEGTNDNKFKQLCMKCVQQNNVANSLIERGYTYIPIGHYFFSKPFTNNSHIIFAKGYSESSKLWFNQLLQTPLEFTTGLLLQENDEALRKNVLLAIDLLNKSIDFNGKKFVFAHIWCPHPPNIFLADGAPSKDIPYNPKIKDKKQYTVERRKKYVEQVRFATKLAETAIDKIISSDSTAIIVLQSDHGEWNADTLPIDHDFVHDTSFIAQRMPILNAYRVPPAIRAVLYDSISPVNSFRVILNNLGIIREPLIPDSHFVVWWNQKKGALNTEEKH
jgi:hypothetical protein